MAPPPLRPPLRLTPHQSIIFCDIAPNDRGRLEEILRRHGVPLSEDYTAVRRWAMACPALPTCGLAVAESERVMPALIDELETALDTLGLQKEVFTTRMTGCPNGCARPYMAEIGFVGKAPGKYNLYLGGNAGTTRLNREYRASVLGRVPRIGVEAAVEGDWARWLGGSGEFVGMTGFGASAPAAKLYEHFGITAAKIAEAARKLTG